MIIPLINSAYGGWRCCFQQIQGRSCLGNPDPALRQGEDSTVPWDGVRMSYWKLGKSALGKPVSQLACELKFQRKPSYQSSIMSNSFWWKAWVKEIGQMKGWNWREMVEKTAVSRICVTKENWGVGSARLGIGVAKGVSSSGFAGALS